MMKNYNKTHGCNIVKWDRPLHELQEDTDIFQAGDVVCNATYLNPIQQEHQWYTQITIKNVVRAQYVLAEKLTSKNLLCPPNPQILVISGQP